jgi:hypothetical protein
MEKKCYSDSMEENALQIQWKKMLCRLNGRKCCEDSMEA